MQVVGVFEFAAAEELICRSFLLGHFVRAGRPWVGVWVSTALFAFAHMPGLIVCEGFPDDWTRRALLSLLVGGMAYALVTLLAGQIWPAITLHTLFNLALGLGPEDVGLCPA